MTETRTLAAPTAGQAGPRNIVHRTRGSISGPITRLMSPGDLGQVLNPPPVEGFTTFLEGLLKEGVSVSQLRRMVVDNPRMLLGV